MRVITGSARGRKLNAPAGTETRPTSSKVKEAVFSMIQFEIEGARTLDLFAGSGQMGIEALSRGAKNCVFVENSRIAQEIITTNLEQTGLQENARVIGTGVISYLNTAPIGVDIAFVDPPYEKGLIKTILEKLVPIMSSSAVIICESTDDEVLPESIGEMKIARTNKYGKSKITVYRQQETV